jgi:hypothetical protein
MVDARCFRAAAAEARFQEPLQLSRVSGVRALEAHCHRSIAEILKAGCQPSKSAVHRSSAASLADAMQLQFWDEPLVNIFMRE